MKATSLKLICPGVILGLALMGFGCGGGFSPNSIPVGPTSTPIIGTTISGHNTGLLPARVGWVFTMEDLLIVSSNAELQVVIVETDSSVEVSGWIRNLEYVQYFPLYTSESNTVAGLSLADLEQVLYGEISNWEEFGGAGPINIYLHGGDLHMKAALSLFRIVGFDPEKIDTDAITYIDSYNELEEQATLDPLALVLGLRKLVGPGLNFLPINGYSIPPQVMMSLDSRTPFINAELQSLSNYPLQLPVYLYIKDVPGAGEIATEVRTITEQHIGNPY